ncbi:AAA family ATPase [Levilactobacillus yonginensis]|uniref:AAA family ATPase n=1 Tax=Levilactobacillus yonginensis TaxID=1054041 RepID=UPI000F79B84D|nr:AAA family ATPase [Levilactobacillus yonginensis]
MQIQDYSLVLPDGRQLFNRLTAEFVPGKVNILLGANGVGKTTLLDLIAGVSVGDRSHLVGFPTMDHIGYEMQGAPFTGNVTVLEALQMMRVLDVPSATLAEADLPVELQPIAHTRFRDLSGGQRRLVLFTGVCQLQRELYLFDEPENGLDLRAVKRVMAQISCLASSGRTVIMTTHQLRTLPEGTARVLVLAGQCIAFAGTPAAFMAETQTESLEAAYLKENG